jgi:hypothetical protein
MDVIKTELDSSNDTDGEYLHRKCNFVGIQQGTESDVKIGSHLNASWGAVTVVKDEVQHITAKEESVLGLKGEIHPTEEGHVLRAKDDVHCVATKQKDKPVVKNGVCVITTQGKGPSHPAREEVGTEFML